MKCKPTVLVRVLVLDREELVTWMVASMVVVEFETETSFEAFEAFQTRVSCFCTRDETAKEGASYLLRINTRWPPFYWCLCMAILGVRDESQPSQSLER